MAEDYVMNTEGRCGKYIVQTLQPPKLSPEFQAFYDTYAKRLLWMDKNVVPGAFQMNLSWYHSASDVRPLYMHDEHFHDFDEMIGFWAPTPTTPTTWAARSRWAWTASSTGSQNPPSSSSPPG